MTQADHPTVARRYVAGETMDAIGQTYGVCRERIRQVLERQGIFGRVIRPDITRARFEALLPWDVRAVIHYYRGMGCIVDTKSTRKRSRRTAVWLRTIRVDGAIVKVHKVPKPFKPPGAAADHPGWWRFHTTGNHRHVAVLPETGVVELPSRPLHRQVNIPVGPPRPRGGWRIRRRRRELDLTIIEADATKG